MHESALRIVYQIYATSFTNLQAKEQKTTLYQFIRKMYRI